MTPVLSYDGTRFRLRCSFADREWVKRSGFKWRDDLKWYTESAVVAAKLREYATDTAKRQLTQLLIEVSPWLLPLPPPPKGLRLMPHQVEAVYFALDRSRCYLGLDPGLGKTIVAAVIAAALGCPAVYVSPPFLVRNVEEEFRLWAPGVKVAVIPDSVLHRAGELLTLDPGFRGAGVIFIDEAHRFKNPDAKRTLLLFGGKKQPALVDGFPKQIYLSGTPMPNRPIELFPILSKVAPETIEFKNQFEFGRRYCAGHRSRWGWDFTGASNLDELQAGVIHPDGPFMLRQRKALLKLPPKVEEVFVISANMSPRLAKMDAGLGKVYGTVEDLIKKRIATAEGVDGEDLHTATYRRLLGAQKVKPAVEYLKSLLDETDENILVFAFHKGVIASLADQLKTHQPFVITGDTPKAKRHTIVKAFQKDKARRLLIGNYLAMGVGFTLTKANRGIFVEYSWAPGENEQAGDRMHRIGQTGSVLIQYMVYQDSLDKRVIETLLRKRKVTNYI